MRKLELSQTGLVVYHSYRSISFQSVNAVNLASYKDTASIVQLNKGLLFPTEIRFLFDGFDGWIVSENVASRASYIKQNFLGKRGLPNFS